MGVVKESCNWGACLTDLNSRVTRSDGHNVGARDGLRASGLQLGFDVVDHVQTSDGILIGYRKLLGISSTGCAVQQDRSVASLPHSVITKQHQYVLQTFNCIETLSIQKSGHNTNSNVDVDSPFIAAIQEEKQ